MVTRISDKRRTKRGRGSVELSVKRSPPKVIRLQNRKSQDRIKHVESAVEAVELLES